MAGPRLCYDHGASFGYTLQAQAVAFAYRLYLQAMPTGYTYRLYLQAIPTGYTYRLYLQSIRTVRSSREEATFSKCIPFLRSSSSRCMR